MMWKRDHIEIITYQQKAI